MCLMFTLFYTQMRRVLVEREIKNLQTTFDQAVDDVNTELALHQSMSDYLAFDQTIVQIVKAEDKNSFEAYERMVKEFDPMMDSLSYFYPEIRQSTVYGIRPWSFRLHIRCDSIISDKWISHYNSLSCIGRICKYLQISCH